jgi:hypothetical protein
MRILRTINNHNFFYLYYMFYNNNEPVINRIQYNELNYDNFFAWRTCISGFINTYFKIIFFILLVDWLYCLTEWATNSISISKRYFLDKIYRSQDSF